MRSTTFALVLSCIFATGEVFAAPPKALPPDVGSGRVAWFDISTKDLPQAKAFYGTLFNWQFNPVQGTDQAVEIALRGRAIGTLRVADGAIEFLFDHPLDRPLLATLVLPGGFGYVIRQRN